MQFTYNTHMTNATRYDIIDLKVFPVVAAINSLIKLQIIGCCAIVGKNNTCITDQCTNMRNDGRQFVQRITIELEFSFRMWFQSGQKPLYFQIDVYDLLQNFRYN